MNKAKQIACVTGASGMVGSKIVNQLVFGGYKVRALSRNKYFYDPNVDLFFGGLDDKNVLETFLSNAQLLFHCAAELHDKNKMWEVNVSGTERLLHKASKANIQYLCHLSSAGVVGKTRDKWVDEETECEPQNAYEYSKREAEKIVAKGIDGCRVVTIRPTNVIDDTRPGTLEVITKRTKKNRIKLFFIGGECSHIIHVDNVAAAAIHFIELPLDTPECFFVSCDHEVVNTFASMWALYHQSSNQKNTINFNRPFYLPIIVPYLLRKIFKGTGNMGDVRYSSKKLISTGFRFPIDIENTIQRLLQSVQ